MNLKEKFENMADNLFSEIELITYYDKSKNQSKLNIKVYTAISQYFDTNKDRIYGKGNHNKFNELKKYTLTNVQKYVKVMKKLKATSNNLRKEFLTNLVLRSTIGASTLIGLGYTLGDPNFKDIYNSLCNGKLEVLIGVGYTGLVGAILGSLSLFSSKATRERELNSHYRTIEEYKNDLVRTFINYINFS